MSSHPIKINGHDHTLHTHPVIEGVRLDLATGSAIVTAETLNTIASLPYIAPTPHFHWLSPGGPVAASSTNNTTCHIMSYRDMLIRFPSSEKLSYPNRMSDDVYIICGPDAKNIHDISFCFIDSNWIPTPVTP